MPAVPSQDVVRNRGWQLAVAVALTATVFAFASALAELVTLWVTRADYSHGLLVAAFAGYLMWKRRDRFAATIRRWPDPWGLPFFAGGAALLVAGDRFNVAKEWVQPAGFVLCLAGTAVMFCGRWKGLRWAWVPLAILPLAFQLPHSVETKLSFQLRGIATEGANFAFQTVGLPAYTEGNVIVIGDTRLGVEEACAGLSMLLVFVFLVVAIAVLAKSRSVLDRAVAVGSAVPVAVFCNVVRVFFTGLVYHAGWKRLGDAVVHDMAGWAMMPLALALIWAEWKLIDWVVEPGDRLSTEEAVGMVLKRRAVTAAAAGVATPRPAGPVS